MSRFKENELNINEFVKYAENHVGETHELKFQSKRGEYAGKYEILNFEAYEPHFTYRYWSCEGEKEPDGAKLGFYTIKITDSKFYNGKTIKVAVHAYVQECDDMRTDDWYKTKQLYISNINEATGKTLRAYEFGIIDWRVKA